MFVWLLAESVGWTKRGTRQIGPVNLHFEGGLLVPTLKAVAYIVVLFVMHVFLWCPVTGLVQRNLGRRANPRANISTPDDVG